MAPALFLKLVWIAVGGHLGGYCFDAIVLIKGNHFISIYIINPLPDEIV